jgi:hypothetical protein
LLALGDLVKLFVLSEGRGEADPGFGWLVKLLFIHLVGQDASSSVETLAQERHEEVTQANGAADLQAV